MVEFKSFALAMVGHFLSSLLYVLRRLHIINAVVDTSSILDHREELKDLWEKRMMADENQSPPSSVVATEQHKEEGREEKAVKTMNESEAQQVPKVVNGSTHPVANGIDAEDHVIENHAETPESNKIQEKEHTIADSLEDLNTNEYVEEKTYTSELETSLVMKHVTEVVAEAQTIVKMVNTETICEIAHTESTHEVVQLSNEQSDTSATNSHYEPKPPVENDSVVPPSAPAKEDNNNELIDTEPVAPVDVHISHDLITIEDSIEIKSEAVMVDATDNKVIAPTEEDVTPASLEEANIPSIDVPLAPTDTKPIEIELDIKSTDDDDGFVRVGECLPQTEDNEDEQCATEETLVSPFSEMKSTPVTNGHVSPAVTPEPRGEVAKDPEMEQFVRSGGLKRLLVQKTEQPYSPCDTETKIAIEIREMREREEELRVMREQQRSSPVPPKSMSPAPKEQPATQRLTSPVPAPTTAYRVSSVFGSTRSGTTSPGHILEDERKKNKETAVEREIRLAKDREEELRKQQGLPPREDDSYVKPSQVKSSQVRVFGKAANNSSAVRQAATAKIQMEIEEQTQREMALRETGSIQTISQERTDSKVAKLKSPDPPNAHAVNGNSHPLNGNAHSNGRASPDKRSSLSPTGTRPISMQKFIASRGKEMPFAAPRNGLPILPVGNGTKPSNPQLKRMQSVESKIQQEIQEMKQREEELKKRNSNLNIEDNDGNGMEHEMNLKNAYDLENGNYEEDLNPRHNKLIAQWEQRIQKAES